jgi:hypothetical protein
MIIRNTGALKMERSDQNKRQLALFKQVEINHAMLATTQK